MKLKEVTIEINGKDVKFYPLSGVLMAAIRTGKVHAYNYECRPWLTANEVFSDLNYQYSLIEADNLSDVIAQLMETPELG